MKLFNGHTLLLIFALLPLSACATIEHSAESIEAWVVDAATNQPIEGVVVVAHWELDRRVWGSFAHSGADLRGPLQLKIMESVTDANGRFFFPEWGPLPTPFNSYLEGRDPHIIIFKPGYAYYSTANAGFKRVDPLVSSTRTSWINGTTIKLKKFEGNLKGYAESLISWNSHLRFAQQSGNCDWKLIPRMLIAMHRQAKVFHQNKIYTSLRTLSDIDDSHKRDECGSALELLKEY